MALPRSFHCDASISEATFERLWPDGFLEPVRSGATMTVELYRQRYERALATARVRLGATVATFERLDVAMTLAHGRRRSFDHILDVEGCSPNEIEQVRAQLLFPLPQAVEAFLAVMGRATADVDIGIDCRHHAIVEGADAYQDWLDEVARNGYDWYRPDAFVIPETALILGHHGGGHFQFLVDRVPDPEIWILDEGPLDRGNGVRCGQLTFSQLVELSIDRAVDHYLSRLPPSSTTSDER